jgi:colicin import membrane protein
MARTGDEDEVGYGASVAYLSDAARRRAERGDPSPDDAAPTPDPDAGIELITSLDAGEDEVEESADDALERALGRRHGAPDVAPGVLPVPETRERESRVDPAGPHEGEQRGVREALEHHHERRDSRAPATITPRGSADLPPRARRSSAPSRPRSSNTASRPRPRHLVAGSLAVVSLIVIAIGVEAGSSTATRHRAAAAVTRVSTQNVASPISLIALELKRTSVAIGAEGEIAASAHAAIEAKAKARVEARARARAQAAQRARAGAARRRRAAAQHAHAASTAGPAAVVSTQTTATDQVSTTPASSASPSSTGSSSNTPSVAGASGSSTAPAGPTAIGSAGSNCNPKCS